MPELSEFQTLINQIVKHLRNWGIYIAPIKASILYVHNDLLLNILISREADEKYHSLWNIISQELLKTYQDIGLNVVVSFYVNPEKMSGTIIYDNNNSIMSEYTVLELLKKFPPQGVALFNALKAYVNSYEIQKEIIKHKLDAQDLLVRVLKQRVILDYINNIPSHFKDEQTPIIINLMSQRTHDVINDAFFTLIHELTHMIDGLVGKLTLNPKYYRQTHELFRPNLFDLETFDVFASLFPNWDPNFSKISNDKLNQLYKRLRAQNNPKLTNEEYGKLVQDNEIWYNRHIAHIVGISYSEFLVALRNSLLNFSTYRTDNREFFAAVNSINFLIQLGLTKNEIQKIIVNPPNIDTLIIPEEWYLYAKGLGWDYETTQQKLQLLIHNITRLPFDILWDYITSPTIRERQKTMGQQEFSFANNWYKRYIYANS